MFCDFSNCGVNKVIVESTLANFVTLGFQLPWKSSHLTWGQLCEDWEEENVFLVVNHIAILWWSFKTHRPPKNFDAALNNIGSHDLAIYSRTDFLRMSFFSPNVSYCSAMLVVVGFGFVSVVNQRLCWLKSGTSSNIGCRLVILLNPAYRSLEHISWPIHRTIIQSSNMDWLIHT